MLSQDAGPSTIMTIHQPGPPQSALGRRLERACDMCRRKKVKCDGVRDSGSRCTNCIINTWDCTYVEISLRRAPPKSYVDSLEHRVKQLTQLISKISPETVQELDEEDGLGALTKSVTLQTSPSTPIHILESFYAKGRRANDVMPALLRHVTHLPTTQTDSLEVFGEDLKEEEEEPDEVVENTALATVLESMSLRENNLRSSRHSSGVQYIETAYKLKQEALHHKGVTIEELNRHHIDDDFATFSENWAASTCQSFHGKLVFPPHDLMFHLIDLYFKHMNTFYPFLHRPTFERSIVDGVQINNDLFAATLLLVCAIGARYSDDPRVLLDRDDPRWETVSDMTDEQFSYSRGWQWAIQVPVIQRPPTEPPSLYELQFYVLWAEFLQGASAAQSCWPAIGFGIRIAQEVGVSRRKSHSLTLEDELWKRAFWVLVSLDRHFSSALGRPCAMHDEDFDVELPIECDDEYLDHPDPKQRFKQPPHKPSIVSYFNCYLRLNQILAFLLRTVYTINRSKILFGYVGQGEQKMISELDSALNQWEESLPAHMQWDPNRADETFFNQSATLHSAYQYVRILVHRPFLPSPHNGNLREYPSLAICTNAARSCANALDAQRRRVRFAPQPLQGMAFAAGVMLLMRIWSGKRAGLTTDVEREMADVKKCLDSLKAAEVRHYAAGRQWDILNVLSTMEDLPIKREASDSPPFSSGLGIQGHEASPPGHVTNPIEIDQGYDAPGAAYGFQDFSVQIIYGDRVSPPSAGAPQQQSNYPQFQTSSGFWYDTARPHITSQGGSPQAPGQVVGSQIGYGQQYPAAANIQQQQQPQSMYQQQTQPAYVQPQVTGGAEREIPRLNGASGFAQPTQATIQRTNPYPTPPSNPPSNPINPAAGQYPRRPSAPQNAAHSREGSHHYSAPTTNSTTSPYGQQPPLPAPVPVPVQQQQQQQQQQQPANNYQQAVTGGQPAFDPQGNRMYPTPPPKPQQAPSGVQGSYFPPVSGMSAPNANMHQHQHSSSGSFGQPAKPSQPSTPTNGYAPQNQRGYGYGPSGEVGSPSESYNHVRSGSNSVHVPPHSRNLSGYEQAAPKTATDYAAASGYGTTPYAAVPAGPQPNVQPSQVRGVASPGASQAYGRGMVAPAQGAPYYTGPQQPQPYERQQLPQQYQNSDSGYAQNGQMNGQMGYNPSNNSNPPAMTMAPGTQAMPSNQQPRSMPFQKNMYAMWSDAPVGFRVDEWGQYLSDMNVTVHHGVSKEMNGHQQPAMQNYVWQPQNS